MKKLLFLLFPILFLAQSISPAEKSALLSLYHNANGKHWAITWDLNTDPSNWYGVKIQNQHVVELRLNANHLKGNFPASITSLSHLKVLDLSSNNLSGDLNVSFSVFANLEELNLSYNNLTGNPSLNLSQIPTLQHLSIGNNQFEIVDGNAFVSNFPDIVSLDLSSTKISTIPANLSTKTNLRRLKLANNNLETGFQNLSSLISLTELNLSNTGLIKIPSEITALSNLEILDLSQNKIENFAGLSQFKNLSWLSLEQNGLETLPNELATLQNLIHINIGRNQLTDISSLISLANLQQIYAHNNMLSGNFPTGVLSLKNLHMLSLNSNQLTGSIPSNIPEITQIQNNRFSLNDVKAYFSNYPAKTIFDYSPQRYDEKESVGAAIGGSATLKQSLSAAEGYIFTWLKSLSLDTRNHFENYYINKVEGGDFTDYTCEAYYFKQNGDTYFEMSLFREPISLDNSLSSQENPLKEIKIYPVPTSDVLNISSGNMNIKKSTIYDMSGKLLLSDSQKKISVSHLPSGNYIIVIETEEGLKTFKFLKH